MTVGSVHYILAIHGVKSLIKSQLHFKFNVWGFFFSISFFYQLHFFPSFETCLFISYRCTWHSSCFPQPSLRCDVWSALGSCKEILLVIHEQQRAAASSSGSELLQCLSTGGRQMRLTPWSSASPVPLHCSTIASQCQTHEAEQHERPFLPTSACRTVTMNLCGLVV